MGIDPDWIRRQWLRSFRRLRRCLTSPIGCLRQSLRQARRHWPIERFEPSEESEFQRFRTEQVFPQARVGIALSFVAWLAYALWDVAAFGGASGPLLAIRLLTVAPALGLLWWVIEKRSELFKANIDRLLLAAPLLASFGLLLMTIVSISAEPTRSFTLLVPGFSAICFFQYAFLGLPMASAATLGVSVSGCVIAVAVGASVSLRMLTVFGMELVLMNGLGILVSARNEIHLRTLFRMRQHYRRQVSAARAERTRAEAATLSARMEREKVDALTRDKERFFKAAFHDLQQPLSIIGLYARLARSKIPEPATPALLTDLSVIEGASQEIAAMFKGVRETWEIEQTEPEIGPVDVLELLSEIVSGVHRQATRKGLTLRLRSPRKSLECVLSDRRLLKRALANLISNAIKYTHSGGVVVGAVRCGDYTRVIVRDTGIGISEDHHQRIFDEYFRVNDGERAGCRGLGLGLSIVSRIEQSLPRHGLDFWSQPGRGSRFSLTIPNAPQSGAARGQGCIRAEFSKSATLAGKYVFIVEDEHRLLDGLVEAVRAAGCIVDGAGCLDSARSALAARDRCPDVLVTDYRLQHGRTGLDVVSAMRDRFEWATTTPIVFLTGDLAWPAPSEGFDGRWEVVKKPIDPDLLLHRLSALVNRPVQTFRRSAC